MPTSQLAVAHLAGLRIALVPAEALGAVGHALDQLAGRVRLAGLWMGVRLVADAQLDRIEPQLFGELVHGALEAHHARRLARRAHGAGDGDVDPLQEVAGQPVRRGIERAREVGGALDERRVLGAVGGRLQSECRQPAVAVGAQAHALNRRRPMDRGVEHLLAGERDLDRRLQVAGGERRQLQVLVGRALAAEPAADVARQHVHLAAVDLQRLGQQMLRGFQHLHRGVDHELVVPPTTRWWRRAPSGSGSGSGSCRSGRAGPPRRRTPPRSRRCAPRRSAPARPWPGRTRTRRPWPGSARGSGRRRLGRSPACRRRRRRPAGRRRRCLALRTPAWPRPGCRRSCARRSPPDLTAGRRRARPGCTPGEARAAASSTAAHAAGQPISAPITTP